MVHHQIHEVVLQERRRNTSKREQGGWYKRSVLSSGGLPRSPLPNSMNRSRETLCRLPSADRQTGILDSCA